MKSNFHTHTYRCKHAYGTEKDYADEAVRKGLDILGFSDHAPFPDKDFGCRMDFSDFRPYCEAVDSLKNVLDQIRIYKGLEIEYLPCYEAYYRTLLDKKEGYGMDYLALGEHFYGENKDSIRNIFFAESTEDYVEYAENIAIAAATGFFTFIAHPDIMFINEHDFDSRAEKACQIILSAAEKYDLPLEFNANGLRRGLRNYPDGRRYPYPHDRFWSELSGSSQKVIIGADCHIPEQLYDRFVEAAYESCDRLGLNVVYSLWEEDLK